MLVTILNIICYLFIITFLFQGLLKTMAGKIDEGIAGIAISIGLSFVLLEVLKAKFDSSNPAIPIGLLIISFIFAVAGEKAGKEELETVETVGCGGSFFLTLTSYFFVF